MKMCPAEECVCFPFAPIVDSSLTEGRCVFVRPVQLAGAAINRGEKGPRVCRQGCERWPRLKRRVLPKTGGKQCGLRPHRGKGRVTARDALIYKALRAATSDSSVWNAPSLPMSVQSSIDRYFHRARCRRRSPARSAATACSVAWSVAMRAGRT